MTWWHRFVFAATRAVLGPASALAFRLRRPGEGDLPRHGPAMIVANHASFLDPFLIGLCVGRPVRYLVSQQFYRDPRIHWCLRAYGTIPVGGDANLVRSFRRVTEVIRRGGIVGVFPEGGITRDGTMRPFQDGAATLALRLGVPVTPVHIQGTFEALPRHARWPRFVPVTVRAGAPIAVAARRHPQPDEIAALTARLRGAVEALASSG